MFFRAFTGEVSRPIRKLAGASSSLINVCLILFSFVCFNFFMNNNMLSFGWLVVNTRRLSSQLISKKNLKEMAYQT